MDIKEHARKGALMAIEVLIDADVMQHCLYNPLFDMNENEKEIFKRLKDEFELR